MNDGDSIQQVANLEKRVLVFKDDINPNLRESYNFYYLCINNKPPLSFLATTFEIILYIPLHKEMGLKEFRVLAYLYLRIRTKKVWFNLLKFFSKLKDSFTTLMISSLSR